MDYVEQRLAGFIRVLRKKKVAIYSFGNLGHQINELLRNSYNIVPNVIVDC